MRKGIFYGVSVGPGDPELMTLKAVRTIGQTEVIAVPETREGTCLALEIAGQAVDLTGKTILKFPFSMERDRDRQEANHRQLAASVMQYLDAGKDVAMLNLGDVSIYSTYGHLKQITEQHGYETVMIPGVPSFCAAASAMGIQLAEGECPINIHPVDTEEMEKILDLPGTGVFMKPGRERDAFVRAVREKHLEDSCRIITRCGLPGERIYDSLEEWCGSDPSYFSLVVIKK